MRRGWYAAATPTRKRRIEHSLAIGRQMRLAGGEDNSNSLATQSQIGDQLQVAVVLGAGQVIQQSAALADHLEQAAA
jgi:hypothetical protein